MFGILSITFICIVAYGVVSRGLFMYEDLEFTFKSIVANVFYRPYWFLYSIADDEKEDLDSIILLAQEFYLPTYFRNNLFEYKYNETTDRSNCNSHSSCFSYAVH